MEKNDEGPGVHLRSFSTGGADSHSIARWAPRWYKGDRRTLAFLGARDSSGEPLKDLEPEEFRDRYYEYLWTIRGNVAHWLSGLRASERLVLCCWCTQERQKAYPRLFCHRILVGHLIEVYRPDVRVFYEDGAEKSVWLDNKAARVAPGVITRPLIQ